MKTICIYHNNDLDGVCSGAIVKKVIPEAELIGWDYGDPFPWDKVKGNKVFLVDLSLQPFNPCMLNLKQDAKELIWIDHHIRAINDANENRFTTPGLLRTSRSACELCWQYFYPILNIIIPESVELLGDYDTFRFKEFSEEAQDNVLCFQYGARSLDLTPVSPQWDALFDTIDGPGMSSEIKQIINKGKSILPYQKVMDKEYAKKHCFEAEFNGLRAICINRGKSSTQLFESVWNPVVHDIMVAFVKIKDDLWTVSLYTDKEGIDCSKLAKKHGGSGHTKAAGFQCKDVPLKIKMKRK